MRERPRCAKVRPMSNLADMLKNPNAYRGACGDLCAGALRLTPAELADDLPEPVQIATRNLIVATRLRQTKSTMSR